MSRYSGVCGFFALEATTRQRGAASSLDASSDDRGTTRLIIAAYATSIIAAPLLRRNPVVGAVAALLGIAYHR